MNSIESVLAPLRGLTDGQLRPHAEACGISVHTIRNALTKTKAPRIDTFIKICEVSRRVSSSPSVNSLSEGSSAPPN